MLSRSWPAAGLLTLSACSDVCGNHVISQVASPDGLHSAVLFQRDCGATTGFSTQVSVMAKESVPSSGGNAFSADDDHGAAAAGEWGGPWAELRWIDAGHLLVRYADKSRVFKQDREVDGVKVTFVRVSN